MVAASLVLRMLSQAPARVIKIDGDSDYMIGDVRSGDEVRKTGSGTALLVVPLAKENVTIRIEGTGDVYLMGLQDYSSIKVEGAGPGEGSTGPPGTRTRRMERLPRWRPGPTRPG